MTEDGRNGESFERMAICRQQEGAMYRDAMPVCPERKTCRDGRSKVMLWRCKRRCRRSITPTPRCLPTNWNASTVEAGSVPAAQHKFRSQAIIFCGKLGKKASSSHAALIEKS